MTTPQAMPMKLAAGPRMLEPIFVDRLTAAQVLGISGSTFSDLVRTGKIAKPYLISAGRVGWRWADLLAFADARPVADLPPPPNCANRRGKRAANDETPAA